MTRGNVRAIFVKAGKDEGRPFRVHPRPIKVFDTPNGRRKSAPPPELNVREYREKTEIYWEQRIRVQREAQLAAWPPAITHKSSNEDDGAHDQEEKIRID